MAYINLPISLDQIVSDLQDQIDRNTTSYSGPQVTADAAQGLAADASTQATVAQAQAVIALQQANLAYAAGAQSIQISAQTIVNSSNQLTAMNTNGITVYSGASSTSGARVVMNSAGIAGFNTYGVTTFAIDASSGAVSTTGAVFTSSTISGGSLNINGNAIIDSSGFLTAQGVTITGSLYSTNGSIGGWNIGSSSLYTGSSPYSATTYLNSSGAAGFAGTITSISPLNISHASGYSYITSLQIGSYMQIVGGYGVTSSWSPNSTNTYDLGIGANSYQWNHIYLHNSPVVNSDSRLKTNVNTSTLGLDFINSLRPVSYKMISGGNKIDVDNEGNPIIIGKDANGKDIFQVTSIAGKRTHWGFLAQEVKEAVNKSGVEDFAGWVLGDLSDPESYQALAYEQFIAPLTKAVQELSARLDQLEGK